MTISRLMRLWEGAWEGAWEGGGGRSEAQDVKQPEFNGIVMGKCLVCPVVLAALLMRFKSHLILI